MGGHGRAWVTLALAFILLSLPASPVRGESPRGVRPWSFTVHLTCTSPTSTPNATLSDIVFANNTNLTGYNNYTLVNGGTYTRGSFSGLQLTNVSEIVILGHPPVSCPDTSVVEDDLNVSTGGMFYANLTFSPSNSTITPLPLPPASPGPILPLFVALVGVGVVALSLWFFVIALRRTTEVLP